MEKRFANKNAVIIAVVLGVILILSGLYLSKQQNKTSKEEIGSLSVQSSAQKIVADIVSVDSDNDGLKDWEELLLKTDPKNPDTDGDGTSDGEEISLGRDPLIPGPDDQSTGDILRKTQIDRSAVENLSETERLAFELFEGYIDLKQKRYLGTEIEENFVTGLVQKNLPEITHTPYYIETIFTSGDTSKEAVLNYREQLAVALEPLFEVKEDELITFARIIEGGDKTGYAKLEFAQKKHIETVASLLGMSVPENVKSIQLDLINSLDFFSVVIEKMISTNEDPLLALVVIDGYTEGDENIKAVTERLNTYFLSYGIENE